MHRELACYGEEWYDEPAAGLDRGARERVADAKTTARRAGHAATPPQMVATLPFGFWVALLRSGGRIELAGPKADYERTRWRPALRARRRTTSVRAGGRLFAPRSPCTLPSDFAG